MKFSILQQEIHGRKFMSLSEKYEEKVQKFSFLARYQVKTELHHLFIFISFIFTSVKIILDCIIVFLDPQCIVSKEDVQHKVQNWSTLLPLLSLHASRAGKKGQKL